LSNFVVNPYISFPTGAEVCQDLGADETSMQLFIPPASGNKTGCGVIITNTGEGAEFIGMQVDTVKIWLKKAVGAPDNSFSVGIFRASAPATEIYNFHNGNLSAITTSMVQYEFTSTSGSKHTIADGDIIGIMYPHNSGVLYAKNNNGGGLTGLVFALYNEWNQLVNWNIWTYQSANTFTFCVS